MGIVTDVAASSEPSAPSPDAGAAPAFDPVALIRTKGYVQLLILAALIGIPVSAIAYFFLKLVALLQKWFFTTMPHEIGFHGTPAWWPLPLLAIAGVLVSLTITYLPGTAGHLPAEGFKAGGAPSAAELPGVFIAALATLSLGVVLGPEAPLIAIGGGLGALTVQLAKKDAPPMVPMVMAAAGTFAAISTLLGSPIVGAFLLMEASGLGGPTLGLVLVPGLLAAGMGTMIFIGLDNLTGFGTFSLAIPGIPTFTHLTVALLAWGIAFGVVAPFLGGAIRLLGLGLQGIVIKHPLLLTPLIGCAVAGFAIGYAEVTGHEVADVLFSGQSQLPALVHDAAAYSVGALVLLVLAKSLAYAFSLSSFRGGPIFPAMFVGAAIGVAASHLPGMSLVPGMAMGIGAMVTVMLKLPMTATLLALLLLARDSLALAPLVIVAVVVAFVITAWLPQDVSSLRALVKQKSLTVGPTDEPQPTS